MEIQSGRHERRWVHADTISLLSLGLQLTYILGLFTASIGNRGWPGWLRPYLPRWLGSHDVLHALPAVGLFACGVSLLMAEREIFGRSAPDARIPRLCWVAFVGSVGLILFNAVIIRLYLYNQWIMLTVVAFIPVAAFLFMRLVRRRIV